jgi:uncharacterized FlaG/YvyC family protein
MSYSKVRTKQITHKNADESYSNTEMAFSDNKKKAQKNRDSLIDLMNKIESFAKQNNLELA